MDAAPSTSGSFWPSNWTYTYGRRGLAVPGRLIVLHLLEGGGTGILSLDVPRPHRVFDPRSGQEVGRGRLPEMAPANAEGGSRKDPPVLVFAVD